MKEHDDATAPLAEPTVVDTSLATEGPAELTVDDRGLHAPPEAPPDTAPLEPAELTGPAELGGPPELTTSPPTPGPEKKSRRLLWLGLAVGIPAFALGVVLAARGPILRRVVQVRAAALGIDLAFDDLDVSLGTARLGGVRLSLQRVNGVVVKIDALTLGLHRTTVESIDAEGVSLALEGPATDRLLELASWSNDHVDALEIPGAGRNVKLEWRARAGTAPWLTITGGAMSGDGTKAQLSGSATAFGVAAGMVSANVAMNTAGITLEAGRLQGGAPPILATLRTKSLPHTLDVTLKPVDPSALGDALGIAMPKLGTVSGHVELTLGKTGSAGTASVDVDGWIPPHPHTLDTLVYGKKTALKSKLTLSDDRRAVTFDDLELRAGRLVLRGTGTMGEEDRRTMLRLDLGGNLPCNEIARSTASKELPGFLGDLFGEVAGRAVGGSAHINVAVEADVKNLAAAKVTPKVGVGCALKLPGF